MWKWQTDIKLSSNVKDNYYMSFYLVVENNLKHQHVFVQYMLLYVCVYVAYRAGTGHLSVPMLP